jgi:ribosomal protein S18 acetylase RimI-like enzyme
MAGPDIRLLDPAEPPATWGALAKLHASEIQGGFLTSLGTPVLARLYRAISRSPHAFVFVAEDAGQTVGFLCASTDTKRVYRRVVLTVWPTLLPVLARKLVRWSTVRRCWETLRYPGETADPNLPGAEILNFCVDGARQGRGIGRALFAAMQREYWRRGIRRIRIVTGAGQQSAIRFYDKMGAQPAGRLEVHANIESRVYVFTIQDCQPRTRGEI